MSEEFEEQMSQAESEARAQFEAELRSAEQASKAAVQSQLATEEAAAREAFRRSVQAAKTKAQAEFEAEIAKEKGIATREIETQAAAFKRREEQRAAGAARMALRQEKMRYLREYGVHAAPKSVRQLIAQAEAGKASIRAEVSKAIVEHKKESYQSLEEWERKEREKFTTELASWKATEYRSFTQQLTTWKAEQIQKARTEIYGWKHEAQAGFKQRVATWEAEQRQAYREAEAKAKVAPTPEELVKYDVAAPFGVLDVADLAALSKKGISKEELARFSSILYGTVYFEVPELPEGAKIQGVTFEEGQFKIAYEIPQVEVPTEKPLWEQLAGGVEQFVGRSPGEMITEAIVGKKPKGVPVMVPEIQFTVGAKQPTLLETVAPWAARKVPFGLEVGVEWKEKRITGAEGWRSFTEFAYVPVGVVKEFEATIGSVEALIGKPSIRSSIPTMLSGIFQTGISKITGKPTAAPLEYEVKSIEKHPGLLLGEFVGLYLESKALSKIVEKTWSGLKAVTPKSVKYELGHIARAVKAKTPAIIGKKLWGKEYYAIRLEEEMLWTSPKKPLPYIATITKKEAFVFQQQVIMQYPVEPKHVVQAWRVIRGVPTTPMAVTLTKALEAQTPTKGMGGLAAIQRLERIRPTITAPTPITFFKAPEMALPLVKWPKTIASSAMISLAKALTPFKAKPSPKKVAPAKIQVKAPKRLRVGVLPVALQEMTGVQRLKAGQIERQLTKVGQVQQVKQITKQAQLQAMSYSQIVQAITGKPTFPRIERRGKARRKRGFEFGAWYFKRHPVPTPHELIKQLGG